jgi:peptidoglycan/xylan/chitin deacetylase (PgdA/CDA1 family)
VAARVPILTYHKIAPVDANTIYPGTFVSPAMFESHVGFLKRRGFQSIRLDSIFSPQSPAKPIVLTFDDGFQDFEDNAFPIMQKFGMNGTVFLVSDFIGKTNEWDEKLGDVTRPLMNKESIIRLHSLGVEFGSHTKTHIRLTTHDQRVQDTEIRHSKTELEAMLGFPIDTFCYPYGSYNDISLDAVNVGDYSYAVTCDKGINAETDEAHAHKLKRIAIRNDTPLPIFVYKLWRAFRLGR